MQSIWLTVVAPAPEAPPFCKVISKVVAVWFETRKAAQQHRICALAGPRSAGQLRNCALANAVGQLTVKLQQLDERRCRGGADPGVDDQRLDDLRDVGAVAGSGHPAVGIHRDIRVGVRSRA